MDFGSINGTGNFTRHINEKHSERAQEMYNYLRNESTLSVNSNGKIFQSKLGAAPIVHNDKVKFSRIEFGTEII